MSYYAQQQEFGAEVRRAASLEDFMASAGCTSLYPSRSPESKVPRVAQLTQRTNQFNLTTVRRTEAEVQALAGGDVYTAEVSDRFGDYGLVGVVICRQRARRVLYVDTFLLSCRVLGRGVEHRVAAFLGATLPPLADFFGSHSRTRKRRRTRQRADFLESLCSMGERTDHVKWVRSGRVPAIRTCSKLQWSAPKRSSSQNAQGQTSSCDKAAARSITHASLMSFPPPPALILQAMRWISCPSL